MNKPQPKIAIVCDWLTNQGGAERVVLELHRMFPEAPIYTSVYNRKGNGMEEFAEADIRTSFLQHWPFAKTKYQLYPVLRRRAFEKFDFSQYDIVISSSGAEAKGIKTAKPTVHINYCHSPTHYYWVRPDEYMKTDSMGWFGKLLRFGLRILIKPMRRRDYLAAQRPDVMIANSSVTAERIKQFYDRKVEVIFPPVDTHRFTPPADPPQRRGFVSLGRQVHYMRRDIAVAAASELDVLLRVIGNGPEHDKLQAMSAPNVEFYTDLNDDEVAEALWHAQALIACGVEDFGITSAEALAAGCPVVAYNEGGAQDIITDGKTGWFFEEQTASSLKEVMQEFDSSHFPPDKLIKAADKFSVKNFHEKIRSLTEAQTADN